MDSVTCARPSQLSGQTCVECASQLGMDAKPDGSQEARKRTLRKKLKRWWQKASKEVGTTSNHATDINQEIACDINAAKCPNQDFEALIGEAILRSPTCRRSTAGICKDIMKTHDWYRSNRKSGWQEIIAKELMGNPSFQPVVECRKGIIAKNKSVKWQLKHQEGSDEQTSISLNTSEPKRPSDSPVSVAELPAMSTSTSKNSTETGYSAIGKSKGVDRSLSTSKPFISPLSEGTAPTLREIGLGLTEKQNGVDRSLSTSESFISPLSEGTTPLSDIGLGLTEKQKGLDHSLSSPTPSISPFSVMTASSPPHYSSIQSASSEIGSLTSGKRDSPLSFLRFSEKSGPLSLKPKRSWSRISSWMYESAPDSNYRPSLAESLSQADAGSSPMNSAPSGTHKGGRIQLFDPPMDEDTYFKSAQQDNNGNSSSSSTNQKKDTTAASSPESRPVGPFTSEHHGPGKSDDNEGFSDDEDGNQGRKRKRFRSPTRKQNRRKFACVYHKFDPATYGVQNRRYLVCAGTGFEYTSELVRHLRRNHSEYVCGKCLRNYESEELLRDHNKECTVGLRCSQEERWAALWRARFPGVPVPQDPYLENSEIPPLPMINTEIQIDSPSEPRESGTSQDFGSTSPGTFIGNSSPSTSTRLQGDCPTPASSNGPANAFGPSLTDNVKLLQNRVDSLEKRLPLLEEMLSFMLKLTASTNTSKAGAGGTATPQDSRTTPYSFKHPADATTPAFLSPASAIRPSCSSSGSETTDIHNPQSYETTLNETLEGDTLTPGLEQYVNEILEGGPSLQGHGVHQDLQRTSNSCNSSNSSNSLDNGNNNCPELMDLTTNELELLLGNGNQHDGHPSQMDLLLDVQS